MAKTLSQVASAGRLSATRRDAMCKYATIAALIVVAAMLFPHHRMHAILEACLSIGFAAIAGAVAVMWPLLDPEMVDLPMAALVAFVGCDGSGKSTLSTDILAEFDGRTPMKLCYLGLGSGAIGERIKRLPLIGPPFERRLAKKATQSRTKGQKIPGIATAVVIYGFSLLRLRRFRKMLALRRAGTPVITDRYPQTEIAGFYDGPGLSAARADSRLVAFLAKRELRMYAWMASFRPDVVIRLNVDLETAYSRKPDHRYELLREKVRVTPRLRFAGAPIRDLDAGQPYENVRSAASLVIHDVLQPHRLAA